MKDTAKTDSPNFKFIDCTSGVQHLNDISNALYNKKEIRGQFGTAFNVDYAEFKASLELFRRCYYKGEVKSRCTRSIISTELLLKNIYATILECKDSVIYPHLAILIEAALKGVYDNCSLGQGDSYLPREEVGNEWTDIPVYAENGFVKFSGEPVSNWVDHYDVLGFVFPDGSLEPTPRRKLDSGTIQFCSAVRIMNSKAACNSACDSCGSHKNCNG